MEEKIKELFADQTFAEKIMALETPEEVQACLEENGVEISIGEIVKIKEMLLEKANGNLTEDQLENVTGGSLIAVFVCAAIAATTSASVCLKLKW